MFKGLIGETMGSLAHKIMLDKTVYHELNNVTIPTTDGTTQIDHIIVSRFGIFVIEAKNMNGWIFGNEKSAEWTQSFPGGKFKFQNPLRQNYRHTKCLSDFLGIEHNKLHSVVMFWGESTFKTSMPVNVLDKGYSSYIKSKSEVLFTDDEVEQIVTAIQTGKLPRMWATHKLHVASLKERHASPVASNSLKSGDPSCPLCGKTMLKRLAKKGSNAGNEFWGCSGYPGCKGIVNI
ncbi:nuclease-related domain-containing protein [Sulfurirhabdus autotrophica]|nr:NERD domain-containing protein [Sulfurirhabdus autotrophica]